jgi:hypothetical protein
VHVLNVRLNFLLNVLLNLHLLQENVDVTGLVNNFLVLLRIATDDGANSTEDVGVGYGADNQYENDVDLLDIIVLPP